MIRFEAVDRGLRLLDSLEEVEYVLDIGTEDAPIEPAPASTDSFPAPLDAAVEIQTDQLCLPTVVDYHLRDEDGGFRELVAGGEQHLAGTTFFEATNTPMKLYLRFDGPAAIETEGNRTLVQFDDPGSVTVGARSLHQRPAGTVTVPETPAGVARGLSLFGSALQTTSPERSFPTLRGHPPRLVVGDEFDAEGLERPDTGIRIEVPEDYESVFTVAPLSYYLGAEIVTGVGDPRVVAGGGSFPLTGDLPTAVAETLHHCFLLDCVTRTEGRYPVKLAEHEQLAARTEIHPERWYDLPIADRTAAYLSIPTEKTADLLDWHLTADVEPEARNAAILPYVVNDLAAVRSPAPTGADPVDTGDDDLGEFFRGPATEETQNADEGAIVSPVPTDTYGHVWVGEGFPMGASKPTVDAYRRRLDRQPDEDGTTTVTLVCNDAEMLDELDDELYGFLDMLSFEVRRHDDLTTAELREVLAEDTSFLHYVGHVEDEGVQCRDGYLDLATLESTGVEAFLLNGCRSHEQGQALVNAGAFGGVVTLTAVGNARATETGRHLAHLLDIGFDFHGALDVIQRTRISRRDYVIVGDGRVTVSQSDSGTPLLLRCEGRGPDHATFTYQEYPSSRFDLGTMTHPYVEESGRQYLAVGEMASYRVDRETFEETLRSERVPMIVDGDLRWTNSVDLFE
ncbi:caspase family protein [Halolamina salifodinae]|uniref:CHAT domain-containing protein n=1 Tax=Halolamina salifodinae TaxID=1202767 RepID=A0A8T4GVR0_9EURY|nr:caspase family protein [Halolamina salifodinae]MBP1987097.1 hypothetical protein [Halolamina salifodinae]